MNQQKAMWYKKCTLIILMVVVLLASAICFVGCNKSDTDPDLVPSEGLTYDFNDEDKTASVTGIGTCQDTDLVIPSNVEHGYNNFESRIYELLSIKARNASQ